MVERIFFSRKRLQRAFCGLLHLPCSSLSLQLDPCSSVSQEAILTGLQINQSGHLEPRTLPPSTVDL